MREREEREKGSEEQPHGKRKKYRDAERQTQIGREAERQRQRYREAESDTERQT